jgi:Flp pilus assembly protein TadD
MKLFGKKDDAPTDAPELDSPDEMAAAETDMGVDPGSFAEPGAEEMPGDAPLDETALAAPARGPVSGGGGNKKKLMALGGLLALLALGGGAGYYYFVMMDEGATPLQPVPPAAVAAVAPAPAPAPADPVTPANPAPMAAQPAAPAPAPANDPLNSANPGNFAGAPAQPAPAAMPGVTPETTPAGTMQPAAAPAGLGPPPGEEATAVPLTPGAMPSPGTETTAAVPAGIEAPPDEPPQDLPMPASAAPPESNAVPVAAMPAPAGTGTETPAPTAVQNDAPTAPAPVGKPATPGKPSDAEMAIVQNAAVLDQLSTQATPGQPNRPFDPNQAPPDQSTALRTVDQLLEQPAIVRPLPLGWLTVRKEHEAEDVDTRLTVARTALSQNNNQSALQLFNDLKKKYPKDKRILMGRAVALQKLGQYDAALSAYEAVLNNDPKNLEALTNMLGLLKRKDPALAIEKLEQLREAYPYNADITAQLGIAYAGAGRFEDALRHLEMAEALNPGSAYVLYNKAVLYDKMGHSQRAGDLYRQIMRLAASGDLDQELPLDAIKRRLAVLR